MRTQVVHQVDSFTAEAFRGNPAGVCVLDRPAAETWMKLVAREMNLSETAFLHPENDGWRLRWFTPRVEVDLCGHATLASAHVLWETGVLRRDATARFSTRSGLLTAVKTGDFIEMDFPTTPAAPADAPAGLLDALGVRAQFVGKSRFDYMVEVESEARVRALEPDLARLRKVEARGIIVTSRASSAEYDCVSRFFAPGAGVDEDPVTGSAHCTLAPYWAERLGKTSLTAYQASERGGVLKLRVAGDRVLIAGQAITMLRAELLAGTPTS